MTDETLTLARQALAGLQQQEALLVSVATGGPNINDVNATYQKNRRKLVAQLSFLHIDYPVPFHDLWGWYTHWTNSELNTYESRRSYLRKEFSVAYERLERILAGTRLTDTGTPVMLSWTDLESRIEGLAKELQAVESNDDLQDVGRRSREIMIDLGKLLSDPSLVEKGATAPKDGNAREWMELFLSSHASSEHSELRKLCRAAWDLAQVVTHGNVSRVEAFAAAQATILIVRTFQQLISIG